MMHCAWQTRDGRNIRGPVSRPLRVAEEFYHPHGGDQDGHAFVWPRRTVVEIEQMLQEAYARADEVNAAVYDYGEDEPPLEDFGSTEGLDPNFEDFADLLHESGEPVYEGCTQSRMQSGVVLMTLVNLYSVSHNFMNALLKYVGEDLLPSSNCLPRSTYDVKRMVLKMGLQHKAVHCCPNGHILYEGSNYKDCRECPTCNEPRYIPGSNDIPVKVVRYFSLIDRLRRMYRCPEIAKLLASHVDQKSIDGKMRSVIDSPQWAALDNLPGNFGSAPTDLRLGLVADGICPYGNASSKHSTWPILVVIYNLPPWLASKKFFITLTILIPGEKAPTSETIDVFLRPLVEELKKLWDGVVAVNMAKPVGSRNFRLRAALLFTVNDFPAYGLIAGQQVKGFVGCPLCGPDTYSEYSNVLKKMLCMGGRRFLCEGHRFRRSRAAFNGAPEFNPPPGRPTGRDIMERGEERAAFLEFGGEVDDDDDPVKVHGVKRASILFELPYWKVSITQYILNLLRTENEHTYSSTVFSWEKCVQPHACIFSTFMLFDSVV